MDSFILEGLKRGKRKHQFDLLLIFNNLER